MAMVPVSRTTPDTWQAQAHAVIAALCEEAYRAVNPLPPSGRKKAKRYTVPPLARALVHCLNTADQAGAEAVFTTAALLKHAEECSYVLSAD